MTLILTCDRCRAPLSEGDRYCRACGLALHDERLPMAIAPVAVVPWRGAVPGLLQGMALAGAGLALRVVAPRALGFAVRRALGRRARPTTYIEETHVIRRLWIRR